MDVGNSDKCWYKIQEQKEVSVWCTGIHQPISSTVYIETQTIITAMVSDITLLLHEVHNDSAASTDIHRTCCGQKSHHTVPNLSQIP
jgi:hypothetical protein